MHYIKSKLKILDSCHDFSRQITTTYLALGQQKKISSMQLIPRSVITFKLLKVIKYQILCSYLFCMCYDSLCMPHRERQEGLYILNLFRILVQTTFWNKKKKKIEFALEFKNKLLWFALSILTFAREYTNPCFQWHISFITYLTSRDAVKTDLYDVNIRDESRGF
ncbi:hypothetical protein PHYBLDRAFT_161692 [Phycomyces blakesleeanus NRRL 1555(-)]|uniref:Uncharacterized protein n=1 Tax=Phycomyces blakesleeanus (strain ATCC 8743b / DSM 1359 / FGSC 10004 / NBRC 33097 / NRRL 1555) TaxID=763407 RepID=A0A162YJ41_PHYB8|nr:hypothetical protein PHYBLDRAFT_161692 [Phycomyces blakesleeanus NRRL 1555(-)]OAD81055.1 hypothetical protein PHYBLDRAFT_161692 [Phycomyces blakesleeanus NRRL 1555(-)]|eukprot:XP_018299095.1 hypothetical protein PHYBLDRAFT_161692 [Phycomyces blakesleeanus NRRL 1555(-)]